MPTLPPGPAHERRDVAESFGVDPGRYDRSRPRYPDELLREILARAPGRDVLDVGCGTGIVARALDRLGARVLGVEPDPRMAAFARTTGVDVEESTFETWDPAGRRFDAVLAGQTWHWVDPVAGAARAAAVLRPGGVVAAFWNVEQPPDGLADAFAAVYRSVVPGSLHARRWATRDPDPYAPLRATAADGLRRTGAFDEPAASHVVRERVCTRDEWLDQVPTQGGHSLLSAGERAGVLDGLGAAIDAAGGRFPLRCTTTAVHAVRGPG